MNDKEKLVNDIKLYFLNPKKYTGSKKELERQISTLNEYLLNGNSSSDIFEAFAKEYTSDNDLNNPIISAIHKTLSDKQGLSSTRNYKEIYFNEIIQNANDLEGATDLDITISSDDSNYIMAFKYNDNGFSIENIIGFFDTEFHIKKPNLSATGKHGVGIKSLFYFVNSLKIESNIIIDFEIKSIKIEDDSSENQYGIKVSSKLEINLNREEATKTILTITFSKNKIDTTYNIAKLQEFIEKCLSDKFEPEAVEQYFFGDNQSKMIFDARNLLFTDANKGKKSGIKKIIFKTNEKELISLSSDNCGNKVQFDDVEILKSVVKFNDIEKYRYLIFTRNYENKTKQNFSVAFPMNSDLFGASRFYETYYIPDEEYNFKLPLLINSEYSNVSRTKLTDGNQEDKQKIISDIAENINSIYEIMCQENVATSNLGIEISRIFHKLLITDFSNNDINILEANVNNRYLPKFKENNENKKYIVFKRQQKEEYEKVLVGSKSEDKENLKTFYDKIIQSNDSVIYDENSFIEEVKNTYNKGFNDTGFKLKTILNIAENVRDLFYYRILNIFPKEKNAMLSDEDVDKYIPQYSLQDDNNCLRVYVCLKMIGRYKLHPNIDIQGNINGASFFEYLFNDNVENLENEFAPYPTFAQKQSELYSTHYKKLKERLWQLIVNREVEDCQGKIFDNVGEKYCKEHEWCKNHQECKGYMCFYGSNDPRASLKLYYHQNERQIYDFEKEYNTDIFGEELSILLCKKMLKEKKS